MSTPSQNIAFVVLALVTIVPAFLVVTLRNLIHAALLLGVSFVGVAGLYLLLNAEFIAAAQILIYVGAITVLILFAIMLTQGLTGGRFLGPVNTQPLLGLGVSAFVFIVLARFITIQSWPGVFDITASPNPSRILGVQLLTTYIIPFEVSSVLLLVALVAAIVLARDEEIASAGQHLNEIYDDKDPLHALVPPRDGTVRTGAAPTSATEERA